MSTTKYSLRPKQIALLTVLIFSVTSLFAYIVPKVFSFEEKEEAKELKVNLMAAHPLAGSSDNVVICSNDGSELHEIFLCGASAERLITTNIVNLQSITWSRLSDIQTNCSATFNCPSNSPGCNWDDLSTDTQFNVNLGGEYRILVRYADNSTERFYFNVYTNGLNPNPVVTNIDCGTPGSITVNNVPSTYEYSINNGATWQASNVFSITSVSTYDILIRRLNDTDGCLFTLDDIAVNNNAIDAAATLLPISCNSALGAIQVDITNASSTYVYEISQGGSLINSSGPITNSTYTFTDLNAGTYDINVTLASVSACSWIAQETVLPFVNVQPEVVVTKNIDCTDGVITVTKTGGEAPFEYSLNGDVTYTSFTSGNQTIIPISTDGSYTVKVRDASGCEIEAVPVNVAIQPEITFSIVPQDITCNGTDDGSITINVSDTQGYSISYSIDGGTVFQTSNVFSNLAPATYSIIIRKQKAGGTCDLPPSTQVIGQSPAFTASAAVTQEIDCTNGQANITATVTAGGTPIFEYSLDGLNFQPSATFTGLGPGNYTITVKDSNNCLTTVDQTVNAGSNPSELTFLTSDIDCSTGETDVQITVQNGNAPFTYAITAPVSITAPDDTFTALPPNTYTFEVTANDGCKIIRNFVVPDPIQFTSNALVKTNISCTGAADGSIEVSIENFNTSFTVVVEDSSGTPLGLGLSNQTASPLLIPGLAADTYTLRINDENGSCQKVETLTISAPTAALVIDSFAVDNINCGAPGSVTVEVSGGWGNYRYAVVQPDATVTSLQSNKTITGLLQAGTHTINVVDANGCTLNTETFDLIDQGGPTATVDATASNYCYSTTTKGELKIDVTAGIAPFFYSVNNETPLPIASGTFTLSNLTPEDYVIKVIGSNGCETIVADTRISGQLFALAGITKPLGCGATPDAIIEVVPEEGYAPYTYRVDSGSGYSAAIMPFNTPTAGAYTFEVTDDKGCTFITETVNVTSSPAMTTSHNISNTACGKDGTGSLELVAQGGTPPFTYSFNGSPFTAQTLYTGLDAISYNYSIRDALGCEILDVVAIVGAEAAITADVSKTDISCNPVVPPGGNIWGNTKIENIQNATGLLNIKLIRVSSPAAHAAGTARYWTYRNYENVDMSLPAHADGFDIRMYWPHHFYVEITDEKGCIYESPLYEITQPPLPWLQKAETDLDQSCANGATFEIEIGADPGNPATLPGEELIGPFSYRIWPYDENNPPGWRSFENAAENQAFGEDIDTNGIERDFRVNGLLFGVSYAIVLRDDSTGCQRWRGLGVVHAPEAPANNIDVVSTPQSLSCYSGEDGRVRFTVSGADDTGVTDALGDSDFSGPDGNRTVKWSIRHTSDLGVGNNTPASREAWFANYRKSGVQTDSGTGDFDINVTDLKLSWYVVEIETESRCRSGNRFLIYRPRTRLTLELDQYVSASCNLGAQIAVTARGGWNDQRYFNIRNKLDQASWHEYEYAYILATDDPNDLSVVWSADTFQTITPTAYDGTNNVYQVYVRDGGGCIAGLGTPITITHDAEPIIDTIDVTNRCTSTNEIYDVVATLTDPGTNPVNGVPVYIWDGEVTNSASKQLGPGYHNLEVRDENGCSVSQTIHIYPQMVASARITQVEQCAPPNSGEVTINVYGGSLDYSFERVDNSETNTTGVFTGLSHSVTYNFTVTDNQSGCPVQTVSATLDEPVLPSYTREIVQHVSCFGADDGIFRILQNPGVDNLDVTYEYSLDGVTYQTSNLFSDLPAGTYNNINVRSSKNCIQSIPTVVITQPTVLGLTAALASTTITCTNNELDKAQIIATPSGGTGPFQYSFDGGSFSTSNTYDIPYLSAAQTILIDVIDVNNCSVPSGPISFTLPAAAKISATMSTTTPMTCVVDGVYEINVDPSFTNITVSELPGTSGQVTFSGARNTTATIAMGNPNTYSFLITDNNTGCTAKVTQVIAPFDTIDVSATHGSDIICYGASDGTLDFTATGFGAGGFDYVIHRADDSIAQASVTSSSTTAISISGLAAGTYYVGIADVNTGCATRSEMISIQSPVEALDFSIATTQVLTCLGADAQITLTPLGGWGSYEFEVVETLSATVIQAFDSNNVIDNLTGIGYEVRVRDSRGCISPPKSVNITPIDPIVINETTDIFITDPSCPGNNDGSIRVAFSRTNGPTNYEYILTNLATGVSLLPQNSDTFNDLYAGSYAVTIQDQLNCSDITDSPVVLNDPFVLEIDAAITQEPTCTPNSGEITVNATGNLGDIFEYQMIRPTTHSDAGLWLPASSATFSNLGPDTYEFKARNQFGCETPITVIRTINVVEPFSVVIDDSNTTINCFGDDDAVLVAQASGGLGGYMYQLEVNGTLIGTPQASGIFENLSAGTYDIQATSGIDCVAFNAQKIVISDPAELIVPATVTATPIACFGEETGSVTIPATGEAPFSFYISTEPQKAYSSGTFENLAVGSYTVFVQDVNGCEKMTTFTVTGPSDALATQQVRIIDEVCSSDDNGLIEYSITGGTAPYSYAIGDNPSYTTLSGGTLLLDNLDGGFYKILIKDANDCEAELIFEEVKVGSDLSANIETLSECRDGLPFYTATVVFEDETLDTSEIVYDLDDADPNNPDVNDAQSTGVFENITAGTHTLSIVHLGTGCIEAVVINIEAQEALTLTPQDGEINQLLFEAQGGDGIYTYYVDDIAQSQNFYYINTSGTYSVRVVDSKGCEASIEIPMEYIDIEIPNFFTPDGDGYKDKWIIKNSEGFPDMYVRIYDRYGRTIKEFIGQGEWDGSYNKTDLPTGDYWYVIKLNGPNDDREFVGNVTVYR